VAVAVLTTIPRPLLEAQALVPEAQILNQQPGHWQIAAVVAVVAELEVEPLHQELQAL
jgi:hypothetical protein